MRVNVFLNIERKRKFLGTLSDDGGIFFQYAAEFLKTGIEVSPLVMPLSESAWKSSSTLFNGLPGLVADSLPDGWGNLLLDRQLRRQGRRLNQISPLERLCWVGDQGMGALEYEPAEHLDNVHPLEIHLDSVADDVESILSEKESREVLDILQGLNGSSGGARPKVVCLISDDFKTLARGTDFEGGLSPWIVKFNQAEDAKDLGVQEFICSLIAQKAGIDMPQTHLFESSKGPGWFAIERFDRSPKGKIHMQTAAGLLHCDFRLPSLDYQSLMALSGRLCGQKAILEMFKRAVLNYSLGNCDDHAKNFSFLMNADGQWRLSPGYDIVPSASFNSEHMTAVLGEGRQPTRELFLRLASKFELTRAASIRAMDEVAEAVSLYSDLARQYGVKPSPLVKEI